MRSNKMTTFHLAWPILIESLLRTALMAADTFMLSRYADEAVAAVGMLQQFGFFILVIYLMGATGTSILVSQNLGAGKDKTAAEVGRAAFVFNLLLGLGLSLILRLLTTPLLNSLNLEPQVHHYGYQYFSIYSSFSVFQALSILFASILRSYGRSKTPMFVNMGANLLNVIGNYIFIFGPFGIPVLGVTGVAISTIASQGMGMLIMAFLISRDKEIAIFRKNMFPVQRHHIKDVLKIGVPAAGEFLSYNTSQIAILYVITQLGTAALAAYSYALNLTRFSFVVAMALGQANQIMIGHLVGAGKKDEAYRECMRNWLWGTVITVISIGLMGTFRFQIIGLLTKDAEITSILSVLLLLSIIHETARPTNMIVIAGLRGAGDVRYPVLVGISVMWTVSVGLSWLFGIPLGWGMAGIWIARLLDEWIRGGFMLWRWNSRRWESKAFVSKEI